MPGISIRLRCAAPGPRQSATVILAVGVKPAAPAAKVIRLYDRGRARNGSTQIVSMKKTAKQPTDRSPRFSDRDSPPQRPKPSNHQNHHSDVQRHHAKQIRAPIRGCGGKHIAQEVPKESIPFTASSNAFLTRYSANVISHEPKNSGLRYGPRNQIYGSHDSASTIRGLCVQWGA